jgi:energy-coupling factor transporter ATP-binding protein EcfA2
MTLPLEFAGFGFTYAGAAHASMSEVSLAFPAGKVVSVIAPQGMGKTTLLRAAAGLLGEIYPGVAAGSVIRSSSARPGAFFDGYVQVTLAVETVREEIALPLHAAGLGRAGREARVDAVARELRIESLLDRDVTTLSGGEEKLVGIAAAFVVESTVHILDEPFEQLDVAHHVSVIRAARNRARRGGLVLVATGSVDTAINIADMAVIGDGATWRLVDKPSYAAAAGIKGLGESAMGRFLAGRGAGISGVRRFRDGVAKIR